MAPDDIIDVLQRHRAKLESKLEALVLQLEAVRRQSGELEVAEKVVRRLMADPASSAPKEGAQTSDPVSSLTVDRHDDAHTVTSPATSGGEGSRESLSPTPLSESNDRGPLVSAAL